MADAHNVGLNLLPEELDERVQLIMGSPRPYSMMQGVDLGFDAVLFIGYHGMRQNPGQQHRAYFQRPGRPL